MLALLAILASGLIVGKLSRHITPAAELLLLLLVAVIVLADYASWAGVRGSSGDHLLRWLFPGH